jgi:hypothetical protein
MVHPFPPIRQSSLRFPVNWVELPPGNGYLSEKNTISQQHFDLIQGSFSCFYPIENQAEFIWNAYATL